MKVVQALVAENGPAVLTLGGLLIGLAFGSLLERTGFCTMGAISDMVIAGDRRRLRAWVLAAATAVIGARALASAGIVDMRLSIYLSPAVSWAGHLGGGLAFGIGMVLAGGCASRNLVRAGSGDLRALLALIVMGLFAYAAIGGLLGPARAWLERASAVSLAGTGAAHQGLDEALRAASGLPGEPAGWIAALALAGVGLAYCLADRRFRTSRPHLVSGLGVGLCVVAGWALTGLAFDDLALRPQPPGSLTFVRPLGDTLEWAQRFTALGWAGFGVGTVAGTALGALSSALLAGRFKLATFADPADTVRVLSGAALMGVGGVSALGCTIGQGITGISALSIGSLLTAAAIVAGAVLGLKALDRFL